MRDYGGIYENKLEKAGVGWKRLVGLEDAENSCGNRLEYTKRRVNELEFALID